MQGPQRGRGRGASAPPPTFLEILKSYWEKVFSVTPPPHFESLVSPHPHFQSSSAGPVIGSLNVQREGRNEEA